MNAADPLTVSRVPAGVSREPYVPLLLLADEPEPLRKYLNTGDLYILHGPEGTPLGVTLVLPWHDEETTAELKAVADYVSPEPTIAGLLDILALPQMQRV